jgi:hypothetical protein
MSRGMALKLPRRREGAEKTPIKIQTWSIVPKCGRINRIDWQSRVAFGLIPNPMGSRPWEHSKKCRWRLASIWSSGRRRWKAPGVEAEFARNSGRFVIWLERVWRRLARLRLCVRRLIALPLAASVHFVCREGGLPIRRCDGRRQLFHHGWGIGTSLRTWTFLAFLILRVVAERTNPQTFDVD